MRFFHHIILITLFLLTGCGKGGLEFSGENAFLYLEAQCEFGPRNPGSDGYDQCKTYLINELSKYADRVITQPFTYDDYIRGGQYDLENIIGLFNEDAERSILLGAHWDTRPWADKEPNENDQTTPIVGANDGASGVAVLLELARMFNEDPPSVGVVIVLFDGEDLGTSGENETYAQGSQYFSKNLPINKPEYGIILDMVGDRNLHLPIERYSFRNAPKLSRSLWKQANQLGLTAFDQSLGYMLYDDHVPLFEYAGIPAVDIIDFDYPTAYANYWHTTEDTPDKCSPESLDQVGTLIVNHIYGIE